MSDADKYDIPAAILAAAWLTKNTLGGSLANASTVSADVFHAMKAALREREPKPSLMHVSKEAVKASAKVSR